MRKKAVLKNCIDVVRVKKKYIVVELLHVYIYVYA